MKNNEILLHEAQKLLGLKKSTIHILARNGVLKLRKLGTLKNSPCVISLEEIERYKRERKKPGRAAHYCEKCKHEKKTCSICEKKVCITNFTITPRGKPVAFCRRCAAKKQLEKRAKLKSK